MAPRPTPHEGGRTTMSQENIAKTRRFYEELEKGNLGVIDELITPNFVDHNPAPWQDP